MTTTAIAKNQQQIVKQTQSEGSLRHDIIVASSAKKISEDLNNEKLLQSIGIICALIGQQPPNSDIKIVLLDYIRKDLGQYTPQEITLAFRMAMKGLLTIELNSIGVLNALTIQKVMDAYKHYTYELKKQQAEPAASIEAFDEDTLFSKSIRELFEKYKTDKYVWDGNWTGKHDWLVGKGLIAAKTTDKAEFESLQKEAQQMWMAETEGKMMKAKNAGEVKRLKDLLTNIRQGDMGQHRDQALKVYAKEIKVKRYFDTLIAQGK